MGIVVKNGAGNKSSHNRVVNQGFFSVETSVETLFALESVPMSLHIFWWFMFCKGELRFVEFGNSNLTETL